MECIDGPAQTGEEPPAIGALAEMALHPRAPRRSELSIEVVGHPPGCPPMVLPETVSIHQGAHFNPPTRFGAGTVLIGAD